MSADNGVYILETKGPEYRVAHLQAVDNVYYSWSTADDGTTNGDEVDDQDIWIMNAREMWFGAPVFTDEDEAWRAARELHDKIDYTEYGISKIEIDRVFNVPGFSVEAYNPVKDFKTFKEAVLFVKREDTEANSIMFHLANGERIKLALNDKREIVLDEFEMGY